MNAIGEMKEAVLRIEVCLSVLKDLHYRASGNAFYGLHIMAGKLVDEFRGYSDDVKENGFIEYGIPTDFEFQNDLVAMLKTLGLDEGEVGNEGLLERVNKALADLNVFLQGRNSGNTSAGMMNLFGGISEGVEKAIFFVNRSI